MTRSAAIIRRDSEITFQLFVILFSLLCHARTGAVRNYWRVHFARNNIRKCLRSAVDASSALRAIPSAPRKFLYLCALVTPDRGVFVRRLVCVFDIQSQQSRRHRSKISRFQLVRGWRAIRATVSGLAFSRAGGVREAKRRIICKYCDLRASSRRTSPRPPFVSLCFTHVCAFCHASGIEYWRKTLSPLSSAVRFHARQASGEETFNNASLRAYLALVFF